MSENWVPVTRENSHRLPGPFYHGTKANLAIGDLLTTGYPSHFEEQRCLKHVYFSALIEPAIWGAELATSLSEIGRAILQRQFKQCWIL